MKKILVLILSILLCLPFVACGSKENDAVLGNVKGSVYENEFIGIGCNLDSQWTFSDEDEIKKMNNIAEDTFGEEIEEILKDADVVYDMYAERFGGIDNININLEKVDPQQLELLDIENNYTQLAPQIVSSFENMGFKNVTYEISSRKIDGKDFPCLNVAYEADGMRLFQSTISIKCDGYLANITFTTSGGDVIDELVETFYLLK